MTINYVDLDSVKRAKSKSHNNEGKTFPRLRICKKRVYLTHIPKVFIQNRLMQLRLLLVLL